jgi:DNA-binding XRE family transcriptional regulator
VRVWADALCKHGKYITTVKYAVNHFFAYFFGVPSGIKQRAICVQVIRLLREERERRGLSKYFVSAQCGITQQTISYMERGLRHPSFETILRIADGIGVNLEDILKQARSAVISKRK